MTDLELNTKIQTLLGIAAGDTKAKALEELILKQSQAKICAYIKTATVPAELDFITIELTVERYNKLGSEGLTSESIEGIQYSYSTSFELEPYAAYLDRYVSSSSGFRFI